MEDTTKVLKIGVLGRVKIAKEHREALLGKRCAERHAVVVAPAVS
jgi:hypothetical protein